MAGAAVALVGAGAVAAFATSGGGETATVRSTPQAEVPRQPDPRELEEQQRRLDLQRADEAARQDARKRLRLEPKGRKPTPTATATPTSAYAGNPVPVGEAQRIAREMLPSFGFDPDTQFGCLVKLWDKESGWRTTAQNPSSGAYGIPQALPGSKMASAGPDWRTNPRTQIKWGLGYIKERYGTPCAAWAHSQRVGWY